MKVQRQGQRKEETPVGIKADQLKMPPRPGMIEPLMVGSEIEVASGHVTEETIRQNISLFTLGIAKDFPEAGFSAGSWLPPFSAARSGRKPDSYLPSLHTKPPGER